MSNEYLEHYGVPGMKWGVRKEQYKKLSGHKKEFLRAYGNSLYDEEKLKKRRDKTAYSEKKK